MVWYGMVPPQPPLSVIRSLRVVASFSTCRRANMVRALTGLRVTLYVRDSLFNFQEQAPES
jgi:hypothetical protein